MERRVCTVSAPGMVIGKTSERLVVKDRGNVVDEIPFIHLDCISVESRGVSISSDIIAECVDRGLPIFFSDLKGPYAMLYSPMLTGTIVTRRTQLEAYRDLRGLQVVLAIIHAKIQNQVNLLRYFGKYRRRTDEDLYQRIVESAAAMVNIKDEMQALSGNCIDDLRGQLLSIEGRAAERYWQMLGQLLYPRLQFNGREHRGSSDPVNAFLNYGYGILYREITAALLLAGLDPYAGFMHVDRSGKQSLVFDMIEPFRPCVVDHALLAYVGKGGGIEMDGEGHLTASARKGVAAKVQERLDATEQFEGKRHRIRTIIHMQARQLVSFLRGDGRFEPLVTRW